MTRFVRTTAVLLAAFHLAVLSLALRPDVDTEYRDYYITRSSDLSPTEHRRLVPLQAGVVHSHLDPALVFEGWGEPDMKGRRSTGRTARITFRLGGPARERDLVLGLRSAGTVRVACSLNQAPARELELGGEDLIRLPLGGASGIAHLDFSFHDAPGAHGDAAAGVEFFSLEIRNNG